jgi:hypothetical protein
LVAVPGVGLIWPLYGRLVWACLVLDSMQIEILYIHGCPNVRATVEQLNNVLQARGFNCSITLTEVGDRETAQAVGFLGSPTVRINDLDIEPSARSRNDYGLMCRTYDGRGGVPPERLIQNAIAEFCRQLPNSRYLPGERDPG